MNCESSPGQSLGSWVRLPSALFSLAFVLGVFLAGCAEREALNVLRGPTMGTTYTVKIAEPVTPDAAASLKIRIDEVLGRINRSMSTYDPESELSRINRSGAEQWIEVSGDLFEVLSIAATVHGDSGGAFDVTVGPLVNLWGFGPHDASPGPPSPEQLEQARAVVGFDLLSLRSTPPSLRKAHREVYIDLSAIAKGYAVDRLAAILEQDSFEHFMVEIGGEIKLRGHNPGGTGWRIALERPDGDRIVPGEVLTLSDMALATSGNYRNFREIDGQRYGHTLDPRTGVPVTHQLAAVTVLHEDAVWADAYATALMVLGPESGPERASDLGIAARFISRDGGRTVIRVTPAYARIARGDGGGQ